MLEFITRKIVKHLRRNKVIKKDEDKQKIQLFNLQQKQAIDYLNSKRKRSINPFLLTPNRSHEASKLKVAICMSGFLRTYERTAPSFVKHVLEPLDADLFIFSPNQLGVSQRLSPENNSVLLSKEDINSRKISDQDIYNYYPKERVKNCVLWDYDPHIFFNKYYNDSHRLTNYHRDYRRTLSFFYHIEQCNLLKIQYEAEKKFKYDVVIRLRGDLGFFSCFNLNNSFKDALDSNFIFFNAFNALTSFGKKFIFTPQIFPYINLKEGCYLPSGEMYFNDFITVGNSPNMDKVCSAYSNISKYANEYLVGQNPETLFVYHILNSGLGADMEDFTTCHLIREDFPSISNEYSLHSKFFYDELNSNFLLSHEVGF